MEGGPSLKDIPWFGTEEDEIKAFVSEELYIHTKLLIADDRVVILGSANMNDRSQLGTHDSEIAVVVEDHTTLPSKMNGHDYQAAKFAASLRRQLFRKHLGLLPPQDWTNPTPNFLPIDKGPNDYDWGSSSDDLVQDPLSPAFNSLWNDTAKMNTEVFAKAFHCVPDDRVRNWDQYEEFFSRRFVTPDKEGKYTNPPPEGKYQYGHVVAEEFPGGAAELKAWLSRVRGTLVEMPLHFMENVDFASGIALNALTEPIYT
jgi:phospholipase D1/2